MNTPRIGDIMFKFSESFLSAIKTAMNEATPDAHPHVQALSGYSGGKGGKAILSFETHNGKILSNDQFGGADHKEQLKTDLSHAHAIATQYAPQDKKAIKHISDWVSASHREVGHVYGRDK